MSGPTVGSRTHRNSNYPVFRAMPPALDGSRESCGRAEGWDTGFFVAFGFFGSRLLLF
jgi:hypothetical protein